MDTHPVPKNNMSSRRETTAASGTVSRHVKLPHEKTILDKKYNKRAESYKHDYSLFTSLATTSTEGGLRKKIYVKPKHRLESYGEKNYRRDQKLLRIIKCKKNGWAQKFLLIDNNSYELKRIRCGCHDKSCFQCQKRRAIKTKFKVLEVIASYKTPVLVTYSPKNFRYFAREKIDQEVQRFTRTREYIKRGINIKTGKKFRFDDYVAITHLERNYRGNPKWKFYRKHGKWKRRQDGVHQEDSWNLNFHMVYDGDYIPVKWARSCYKKATGGESHHVNFNYIHDFSDVAYYVSKYVAKICFDEDAKIEDAKSYYKQTYGLRYIKIVGKRPQKLHSSPFGYRNFYKYLVDIYGDWRDARSKLHEITSQMDNCSLSSFDLTMTLEENFFKYATEEQQLAALGV